MGAFPEWVVLGEAVATRKARPEASAWLASKALELGPGLGDSAILPFQETEGCLLGIVRGDGDPLRAVLEAGLDGDRWPTRWALVLAPAGVPGEESRNGPAAGLARSALALARSGRERLLIRAGEAVTDAWLAAVAPALVELLDGLTRRQRIVAKLAMLEGLRQSDIADRLGVRRATVSVSFARSGIVALERLTAAMRASMRWAAERAGELGALETSADGGVAGEPAPATGRLIGQGISFDAFR